MSDLYYTVFGIDGLLALHQDGTDLGPVPDRVGGYLQAFGNGGNLDLVHLCCLARCWGALLHHPLLRGANQAMRKVRPDEMLQQVERYRAKDGGYNQRMGSETSTAYGCFLAAGAYQDLQVDMLGPSAVEECLSRLQAQDGSWSNVPLGQAQGGSTNATAAAIVTLKSLSAPVTPAAGQWLLARYHSQGGFLAAPTVPMPDLLSTATALHALAVLGVSFEPHRESCLNFIDSLWTNEGGFHGHWLDEALDCEYTYYGLLALGHLSAAP